MSTYTVYLDDSGSRDTDVAVIAGFVGSDDQWAKFSDDWNRVLDHEDYALPPGAVFHMREFAHSINAFSVFRGHESDMGKRMKRRRFIKSLIEIAKARARYSFSCSVQMKDYESVNRSRYQLVEAFGGPFAYSARACAGRVRKWAAQYEIDMQKINFVFEDGIGGKGNVKEVLVRDGFPEPNFRPKGRDAAPLQAADLIAWEFHKHMKQAFEGSLRGLRGSFDNLLKMPGGNEVVPDEATLIGICQKIGVPRR